MLEDPYAGEGRPQVDPDSSLARPGRHLEIAGCLLVTRLLNAVCRSVRLGFLSESDGGRLPGGLYTSDSEESRPLRAVPMVEGAGLVGNLLTQSSTFSSTVLCLLVVNVIAICLRPAAATQQVWRSLAAAGLVENLLLLSRCFQGCLLQPAAAGARTERAQDGEERFGGRCKKKFRPEMH